MILVLLGARMPIVLRIRSDQDVGVDAGGDHDLGGVEWEVIGPCVVPDLMYGLVIAETSRGNIGPSLLKVVLV